MPREGRGILSPREGLFQRLISNKSNNLRTTKTASRGWYGLELVVKLVVELLSGTVL